MTEINIDLSESAIKQRIPLSKKEFASWLTKNHSSIDCIERDLKERNAKLEDIFRGVAIMDIGLKTADEYAKKGNKDYIISILENCKSIKDEIYKKLISAYGGLPKIMENGISENLDNWKNYLMEKYGKAVKLCEFKLTNRGFY